MKSKHTGATESGPDSEDVSRAPNSGDSNSVEFASKNLFDLGRKRSRGRRLFRTSIAMIALVTAAVIFAQIYLQTLEPGFEWKWSE